MQGRRQRQRGPCASIQDSPPWSGIKYPSTHFIGQSRSHGKETDTDLPWTSLGVSAMVCHPNAHNGLQSPRRCFLEIVHKHSNLTISTQSEDIEEGPSLTLTAWSQGILDFADSMSVFQVWLLQSFQIKLFGFANLIFCLFGTTPRYSQSLSLASLRYHSWGGLGNQKGCRESNWSCPLTWHFLQYYLFSLCFACLGSML